MKIFLLEDDGTRTGLILDAIDGRAEVDRTTHVEGGGGAIDLFHGPYDLMLLDHDLGGRQYVGQTDPETGTAFVKWLVDEYPFGTGAFRVIVHSYNVEAAKRMVETLIENDYDAIYRPFGLRLLKTLEDLPYD